MKKIITCLLIGNLLSGCVASRVEPVSAPVIAFVSVVHDYGTINKGDDGTCRFKFVNTGTAPLIIITVRNPCGCIAPSWSQEPVAPGDTSEIRIHYDTQRVGPVTKTVTVISNAVNEPSRVLTIKGNVLPPAEDVAK